MVDFIDKLKDVELNSFMLAIYKDDENGTLLNHSLECYNRHRASIQNYDKFGYRNPMCYVQYPPIDQFKKFIANNNSILYADLKHLKCVDCLAFVIEEIFKIIKETSDQFNLGLQRTFCSSLLLIYNKTGKINEDWMWDYINYGHDHHMTPSTHPELFTSDQALTFAIVA